MHTLLALTSAGIGLTVVPEWMKPLQLGVTYAKPAEVLPKYEILLVWRRDSTNPAIGRLRAVVESTVQLDDEPELVITR